MTIINDVSISHRWDRVGDRGLDPLKKTVDKCKDFNHIYNTGEAESSLLSSFARPKSPAVSMQKYISLDKWNTETKLMSIQRIMSSYLAEYYFLW